MEFPLLFKLDMNPERQSDCELWILLLLVLRTDGDYERHQHVMSFLVILLTIRNRYLDP